MKILGQAAAFIGLMLGATPASATIFTVTYTGTISSGIDFSGVFTQAGGSLAGLEYTSYYKFDSLIGIRDNRSPSLDTLVGGNYYDVVSSLLDASLTINNYTFNFNGLGFSLQSNYALAGEISSYSSDSTGSAFHNANYFGNSLKTSYVPTPITTPYSAIGTRAVGGYTSSFQISYQSSINSNIQRASGNFLPTGVVVAVQAVPEPATWLMMMLGFGMMGYVLRARRTVIASSLPAV